jgi:REP element-mobilizing transposase RayT
MSFVKIWIHSVWGTKNHDKILTKDIRKQLFQHIKDNARKKGMYVDTINGYLEHVHCFLALNADMSISKELQLIKGESAYWANQNKIVKPKLEWADEYFAVSVSETAIDKVREYIKNQEEHHAKLSFSDEFKKFIEKYGFGSQG